ncbi:putative dehydrogenase [Stackebrandtia albiflava]|uniref:Putative dehydrogenase n=1 Tax=Stackebrandtia albiflava TaxID=406432 RepID=A0A562V5H0_9ACTN|nr:Gfo/Idh/MocA family oxidoreductase [Stackebrandtia albiflava]TWJ13048.1 putative dehydrogenase [Stackebrandtia albiflava]
MTEQIRWGILATGGIAATFTEDLKTLPGAVVGAVGSRSTESARRFADRYDIPRAHGSWAELAADEEVDVVYVATPHHAHHEAAKLCLEAGKAVLCEKAFTVNHAQARELVDIARDRGVFLMEAMWMRCVPAIRRLAELLDDGVIGEVARVNADFGLSGPFPPEHRLRDPELAGGALLDLGVYPVSLAHLVLGRPETVHATGRLTAEGVDEVTGMLFGYRSGAVATLSCGLTGGSPVTAMITGSLGRVTIPSPFFRPDGFTVHRADSDEVFRVGYTGHGMVHEAAEVMRCLSEGLTQSPLVPWEATLDVMSVMDDVRRSLGVVYPGESR